MLAAAPPPLSRLFSVIAACRGVNVPSSGQETGSCSEALLKGNLWDDVNQVEMKQKISDGTRTRTRTGKNPALFKHKCLWVL